MTNTAGAMPDTAGASADSAGACRARPFLPVPLRDITGGAPTGRGAGGAGGPAPGLAARLREIPLDPLVGPLVGLAVEHGGREVQVGVRVHA